MIGELGSCRAGLVGQLVLGREGEDRRRDPEPDRAAGDLEHVDQPASLAGGLIYMFQIAGGAIGLGITTTIFTLSSENELADKAGAAGTQLTDHQTAVLHGVLAGTDSGTAAL